MTSRSKGVGVILGVGGLAVATSLAVPASAHISLEQAGTHKSRYGDGELKDGPCGRKGGVRGTNVYTYAPGQKITISVLETIVHPGYFRIAFDDDGDDAFIEPASIKPVDPARKCPSGAGDHCGMSDFYNSPAVLPNMDNLNPHITAASGMKYTWEVTLPNVECTNCTLQLIQVMEDDAFHGPYDPTPGVGVEDIYHQCIDIVLKRSADGGTGPSDAATTDIRTPPSDSGGAGAGGTSADAGRPDSGAGTGGTTTGSGGATGTGGSTTGSGGSGGGTSGGSGGTGGSGTGSGGTGAGATGTGATGGNGSGATGGSGSGATGGTGSGGSAGAGAAAGSGGTGTDGGENGCKCTIGGTRASTSGLTAFALLGLALASRRRRR
jgi:MYXO-CTERM domain-containing protein